MRCCKPGHTLAGAGAGAGSLSFPRASSFFPPASVSSSASKGPGVPLVCAHSPSDPPCGPPKPSQSNSPPPFFPKSWVCSENWHLEKSEFISPYKIGSKLKSTTSGPFCHPVSRQMEARRRAEAPAAARAGCARRWRCPGPGACRPGALPTLSWERRLGAWP